jgi:hypothetical protein
VDVLGHGADGLRQAGLVDAEVRPPRGGRHVRGENQQRRAALSRLGQASGRVREPRALVDGADADLAAHARVAVGHRDGTALVAGAVVSGSGVAQRVAQQHVAAPGETEHDLDTQVHEGPSHCLGDEHRCGTLPILRTPLPAPLAGLWIAAPWTSTLFSPPVS